jgi:hypothetical protein
VAVEHHRRRAKALVAHITAPQPGGERRDIALGHEVEVTDPGRARRASERLAPATPAPEKKVADRPADEMDARLIAKRGEERRRGWKPSHPPDQLLASRYLHARIFACREDERLLGYRRDLRPDH